MKLSPEGFKYIETKEGFSPKPYWDHKGYSIGYGHLMTDAEHEHFKDTDITQEEAAAFLQSDVAASEEDVNRHLKVEITQEQFDALVDFRYNLGITSLITVMNNLDAGKPASFIAGEIKKYDKVRDPHGNLVDSPSLEARRTDEAKSFEEA